MLASRIPHRVNSFASEHVVQVSTWTDLPREFIEIVVKNISHHDLWTCRKISSCWAAAAKASGLLKLVTSLSDSAWNEVPVKLSRLHHLKICNSPVQCCLKVELPDNAACAAMLELLTDQVAQLEAQLHVLAHWRFKVLLSVQFFFAVAQDISCCRASNYLNANYWWP